MGVNLGGQEKGLLYDSLNLFGSFKPAVRVSALFISRPHLVPQIVPLPVTSLLIFQTD